MNLFRLASAVLCALPLWAMAQTFPGKPVRMIGTHTDISERSRISGHRPMRSGEGWRR